MACTCWGVTPSHTAFTTTHLIWQPKIRRQRKICLPKVFADCYKCRSQLFQSCVSNSNFDSTDVFDHPGNPLGIHFSCRAVSDGWPPARDSSGDVRSRPNLDRAADTRAREVWINRRLTSPLPVI